MKSFKILILLLATMFSFNAFSQFIVGPKFGYNTYSQSPGMGFQIGVIAQEKVKATADFVNYSQTTPSHQSSTDASTNITETNSHDRNYYELNFNFSYLFKFDHAYFYPIIGMNIASSKDIYYYNLHQNSSMTSQYGNDIQNSYDRKESTKAGLNLGGGAQYNLGLISPFVECKYTISDFSNGSVYAGILFNIGRKKAIKLQ